MKLAQRYICMPPGRLTRKYVCKKNEYCMWELNPYLRLNMSVFWIFTAAPLNYFTVPLLFSRTWETRTPDILDVGQMSLPLNERPKSGDRGSRTLVRTTLSIVFYMLSLLLRSYEHAEDSLISYQDIRRSWRNSITTTMSIVVSISVFTHTQTKD